jgi:hypothetical protein
MTLTMSMMVGIAEQGAWQREKKKKTPFQFRTPRLTS